MAEHKCRKIVEMMKIRDAVEVAKLATVQEFGFSQGVYFINTFEDLNPETWELFKFDGNVVIDPKVEDTAITAAKTYLLGLLLS